jgi:hypothetical protein
VNRAFLPRLRPRLCRAIPSPTPLLRPRRGRARSRPQGPLLRLRRPSFVAEVPPPTTSSTQPTAELFPDTQCVPYAVSAMPRAPAFGRRPVSVVLHGGSSWSCGAGWFLAVGCCDIELTRRTGEEEEGNFVPGVIPSDTEYVMNI